MIPQIISRYKSPYFAHIFSNDYSAGYYSYLWSEVLDADAFERFKQEGILNPETGADFRKHILSSGSTEDVAELYRRFRGQDPEIGPLMKRRGLTSAH
jgi:peptidyl-dipeptidase Dcp